MSVDFIESNYDIRNSLFRSTSVWIKKLHSKTITTLEPCPLSLLVEIFSNAIGQGSNLAVNLTMNKVLFLKY